MITVYVPVTYLKEISIKTETGWPRPSQFWLSKPDSWMSKDIGTITVTLETWQAWNKTITDSKSSSKQLLKD